jgi:beta-glucosidase-like glycosyl hydrolase
MSLAVDLVYENYKNLTSELVGLGIGGTCSPVVDLSFEGAHDIIGDRSFGSDPNIVSSLVLSAIKGIRDAGGVEVIKHIPGHGRATCDSHFELPRIESALEELELSDFMAFKLIAQSAQYAMTAHIIYRALDDNLPATLSSKVIKYIRNQISFKGMLMTDDISMQALSGDLAALSNKALEAGCDIVLHCNGIMSEMSAIAESISFTKM